MFRMDIMLEDTCFNWEGDGIKKWGGNCFEGGINFEKLGAPTGGQVPAMRVSMGKAQGWQKM